MSETMTTMAVSRPPTQNGAPATQTTGGLGAAAERAVLKGNFKDLNTEQRLAYVRGVCEQLGLNWTTRPFDFIESDDGKSVTMYARADCAAQLVALHSISTEIVSRETTDDCCVFTVRATAPASGKGTHKRSVEDVGIVPLTDKGGAALKGVARANAMMKALTKAFRRATLRVCGLGLMDETEAETIGEPARPMRLPTTEDVTEVKRLASDAASSLARAQAALAGPTIAPNLPASDAQHARIKSLKEQVGLFGDDWKRKVATWGLASAKDATQDQAAQMIRDLEALLVIRQGEDSMGPDGLPNNPPPPPLAGGSQAGATFRQPAIVDGHAVGAQA